MCLLQFILMVYIGKGITGVYDKYHFQYQGRILLYVGAAALFTWFWLAIATIAEEDEYGTNFGDAFFVIKSMYILFWNLAILILCYVQTNFLLKYLDIQWKCGGGSVKGVKGSVFNPLQLSDILVDK